MSANRPAQVRPLTFGEIVVLLLVAWALWATCAQAQLVPIKTAPIATGSQFQIHPAQTRGMGGLSLAVDDTLGDPFVNPATASRLNGTWAYSAPSHYTITGPDGGARTVSVGALVDRGSWFGGVGGALQHLNPGRRLPQVQPTLSTTSTTTRTVRPLREVSAENQYLTLLGGRHLSEQWAVAGMIQWAGLEAMDGVDLLYPGNRGLRQDGHQLDLRVGILREWNGQSLRALLVRHRVDMSHNVRTVDLVELPGEEEPGRTVRWKRYDDRTNTWGLHLEYERPLGTPGWRLGAVLTGNRKSHPKIPNYDLMNIPRDPGTSWASRVGLGVAHSDPHTTVGAELLFAPIVSETWANAKEPLQQPDGGVIAPGERTVVNDFRFANTILRTGLRHRKAWWELQAGIEVRTTRYWLTQNDRVEKTTRHQYEEWSEWTLTWGGGVEWGALTLRYTGHLTLGTGRPGVVSRGVAPNLETKNFAASDFVVAPKGPLAVEENRVFTHQVSLIIPVRGGAE
ncbi:MAG: hypothetical protein ABEK84_00265 [Salinibacter sp.]